MRAESRAGATWNGAALERHRHVCVFYHSADEEYQVLRPFLEEGFRKGHKAVHVIDDQHRREHLRRLREFGTDVEMSQSSGQLEVRGWGQAHLAPGWFDPDAMLALVNEVLSKARSAGFPFTRWVANMGWALSGARGASGAIEYCARLNLVAPRLDATLVCTYDLAGFSAAQVIEILRCHPVAVIGGIVHENPYYVPVDPEKDDRPIESSHEATPPA